MPRFGEILTGMKDHLAGSIAGGVGVAPTPRTPLSRKAVPYATVAPGDQGEGVTTQQQDLSNDDHLHAGQLLITAWTKPRQATEEEATLFLLEQIDNLVARATTATVGRHFSVPTIQAPITIDDKDGILLSQTATVNFFFRRN